MPRPRLENDRLGRWLRLVGVAAVVAVFWLVVLPTVGRQPAIRAYIEHNEERGIDPAAKFYTELPGMSVFADRIDTARRRHAAAFWPD